jgi:hypothetical protein
MEPASIEQNSWILADGHVHFYRNFHESRCLQWAHANFHRYADILHLSGNIERVLLLTETSDADWFIRQRDSVALGTVSKVSGHRFICSAESNSLCCSHDSFGDLFVIAGRQIITQDRLEVLALGLDTPYPDGQPLRKTLSDLQQRECMIVLPWGVGKWLGTRKEALLSLLVDLPPGSFFLGDSGNRPSFWPWPDFSQQTGRLPPVNLPGSDPLPLTNQEKRIGSYGFYLQGPLDQQRPFDDLRRKITLAHATIGTFGHPEKLVPFVYNQTAMQLRRFRKAQRSSIVQSL